MLQVRRALAILGLLAFSVMWGQAVRWETGWMLACAVVFSLGDLLCAVALLRDWYWARWFGLGIGLVGTMNIAVWIALRGLSNESFMLFQGVAFPALFLLLTGERMRARYEGSPSPRNPWRGAQGPVRVLSAAIVLNIATAPMLVLYACFNPSMSLGQRPVALSVAVLTATGVVFTVMRRTLGLVLLCAAGLAACALAMVALPSLLAHSYADPYLQLEQVTAIAAFPAGILGALATGLTFARPMLRFLRT